MILAAFSNMLFMGKKGNVSSKVSYFAVSGFQSRLAFLIRNCDDLNKVAFNIRKVASNVNIVQHA